MSALTCTVEVHQNDEGTILVMTLWKCVNGVLQVANISSATLMELDFKKPITPTPIITKTASFTTDGADGKIQYQFLAVELDEIGWWSTQSYIEMPGWRGFGQIKMFEVHSNLRDYVIHHGIACSDGISTATAAGEVTP